MNESDIAFVPVRVSRGRKFRGDAYRLAGGYVYTRGYANSGIDPRRSTFYAKLWDPASKQTAYCNEDFLEDRTVPQETFEADMKAYADFVISSTVEWCRSKRPSASEAELDSFVRSVLLKCHPELRERIESEYPDGRSAFEEVRKTLEWASGLVSRPAVIYGRRCEGGKPYPPRKKVRIAYKALRRKRVTALPGFDEAWELCLTVFAMPVMTRQELEKEFGVGREPAA